MATSDNLKIARLYARTERDRANIDLARAILANPVIELVAGVSILEYEARHGIIGTGVNVASLAALYAIIGVQVLAPVLPQVTAATSNIIGVVTKALPALALL